MGEVGGGLTFPRSLSHPLSFLPGRVTYVFLSSKLQELVPGACAAQLAHFCYLYNFKQTFSYSLEEEEEKKGIWVFFLRN